MFKAYIARTSLLGAFFALSANIVAVQSAVHAKGTYAATLVTQAGDSLLSTAALSSDDREMAVGRQDGIVILWDMQSQLQLQRFEGHANGITSIAFSPNGKALLTGSDDGTARLWDIATGKTLRRFDAHGLSANSRWDDSFAAASVAVNAVAFSPDGREVMTGSSDKCARLWDIKTGKVVQRFVGHSDPIYAMAFSPDGRKVLTGANDKTVRLWSVETGIELKRFEGHSEHISYVAFYRDDREILTGSWDRTARLWDVETGKEIRRFGGDLADGFAPIVSVAVSADGRTIVTDPTVGGPILWDSETGRQLRRFATESQGLITQVGFSRDGSQLFTVSFDMTARLWDTETGRELKRFESSSKVITSVAVSADGSWMVAGSADWTAQLWNMKSGQLALRYIGHEGPVLSVAFSPDGTRVLTGSADQSARLWDTKTGTEIFKFPFSQQVNVVAFSLTDPYALIAGYSNSVQLRDIRTGALVRTFEGYAAENVIFGAAFSRDGKEIAVGGLHLTIWNVMTGEKVKEVTRLSAVPYSVVFSPDGSELLTGGVDAVGPPGGGEAGKELQKFVAMAHLWDVRTGKELQRFHGHTSSVTSVAFSAGGSEVLTGGRDASARLWDVTSGKEIRRYIGHSKAVTSVAFSLDKKWFVTGGDDGAAGIWDLDHGVNTASLIGYTDRGWAVVDGQGRFDTGELDATTPLHWIVSDSPSRPLPLKIFLRTYWEPRLLPRLLARGESAFAPVGDIAKLNRNQPEVGIGLPATGSSPSEALVDVTVSGKTDLSQKNGKTTTAAYDLRLFRNGQLVREYPEPKGGSAGPQQIGAWRKASEIKETLDGRSAMTHTFHVGLSSADHGKPVVFTAYAFNEDRVKSETARNEAFKVPENIAPRAARAYVLTIGINDYHTPGHDLEFAVKDAQVMAEALEKIKAHEVVPITLVTDKAHDGVGAVNQATKANIRAVLEVLAGKVDGQQERERLRAAGIDAKAIAKLDKVTPDDAVIITYSGHGYTERTGAFYLLPAGSWAGEKISPASLPKFISSDELSEWLRDVDAGEMAMIIDACHSAASVDIPGFKPGPMGDRGLGQLAYDKGMRILAATQSDDVALEIRDLKEGLLTYALVEDGLTPDSAGKLPADPEGKGEVTLSAWLKYGEQRTPGLYEDALHHKVTVKPRDSTIDAAFLPAFIAAQQKHAQTPALFDFRKNPEQVIVKEN